MYVDLRTSITLYSVNPSSLHAGTICMFLFSADSFKIDLLKNSLWNANRASNSLDTNQVQRFVGPDRGPNCCVNRLSADTKNSPRQMCSHVFLSQFVKTLVSEKPKKGLRFESSLVDDLHALFLSVVC